MRTRALMLLAALSVAGCATDELPTLALVGFHGLLVEEEGCTHTDAQMSSTTYDTALATSIGMPLNVYVHLRNELNVHADSETGQVEANRVRVNSMRVAFEGEEWSELPAPLELPVTGVVIDPNDDYWKHLTPIAPEVAAIFDRQFAIGEGTYKDLRVRMTFYGETLDGAPVESNELSYLLNLCRGCVGCPSGYVMEHSCQRSIAQGDGFTCTEADEEE